MKPLAHDNAGYLESEEAFDYLYSDMSKVFELPIRLDPNRFQTTYELTQMIRRNFPRTQGLSFCEIGCAPGQWLIYFHQYFKYDVFGMDLSLEGTQLTKDNLKSANVPGEILQADAFHFPFGEKLFDVVFSHSLIEHFQNPMSVFELHNAMTKPGGTIYVGMPNLRYLNQAIFVLVDRLAGKFSELRETQNVQTARPELFKKAAETFGWDIRFLGYVGFFIPLLYEPPQAKRSGKTPHKVGWSVGRNLPTSRFFSPLLCMVATKK